MENRFFNDYYNLLKRSFEGSKQNFCFNSDKAHNAVIMCFMLDHSNDINMYCGSMSVFRNTFYEDINQDESITEITGDELKEAISASLSTFLSKENSKLNVILVKNNVDFEDLLCRDAITNAVSNNKMKVSEISSNLMMKDEISHFTVCKDSSIYRLESDKENHTAVCCFHYKDEQQMLINLFDTLKNNSKQIANIA